MTEYRSAELREQWQTSCWPVSWSAVWVGALTAIAIGLIIGLAGVALGAYKIGTEAHIVSWRKFQVVTLVWSVASAFFSFVVGGWAAGRVRGARHSETAILHGVIAWLVTVPILLAFAAMGSVGHLGVWYEGLQGAPVGVAPSLLVTDPTAAMVAKNAALGAFTALLVGLIGSVIGGWLASGERMTFTYYRTRAAVGMHAR